VGNYIAIFSALFLIWFMADNYPKQERGYAPEHRAELQNKIAGLVPLSTADLNGDWQ